MGTQWFFRRRGEWEPFGQLENMELEAAILSGEDRVEFGAGRYPAIVSERIQHNFDAGTQRDILRGSWFFQRSDGTLCPYPEDLAETLEATFLRNKGMRRESSSGEPVLTTLLKGTPRVPEFEVYIMDDVRIPSRRAKSAATGEPVAVPVDSQRTVYRAIEEGEYAQVHCDTHKVRWVTIVYTEGSLPIKAVTPWTRAQQQQNLTLNPSPSICGTAPVESPGEGTFRLVQWWCQRAGTWQHYNDADNEALEAAYQQPRHSLVRVCGDAAVVDIISKTERTVDGAVLPLLRSKWHVQRSDGSLLPFNNADNTALEKEFVVSPLDCLDHLRVEAHLAALAPKNLSGADFGIPACGILEADASGANSAALESLGARLLLVHTSPPEEALAALVQVVTALASALVKEPVPLVKEHPSHPSHPSHLATASALSCGALVKEPPHLSAASSHTSYTCMLRQTGSGEGFDLLARALALVYLKARSSGSYMLMRAQEQSSGSNLQHSSTSHMRMRPHEHKCPPRAAACGGGLGGWGGAGGGGVGLAAAVRRLGAHVDESRRMLLRCGVDVYGGGGGGGGGGEHPADLARSASVRLLRRCVEVLAAMAEAALHRPPPQGAEDYAEETMSEETMSDGDAARLRRSAAELGGYSWAAVSVEGEGRLVLPDTETGYVQMQALTGNVRRVCRGFTPGRLPLHTHLCASTPPPQREGGARHPPPPPHPHQPLPAHAAPRAQQQQQQRAAEGLPQHHITAGGGGGGHALGGGGDLARWLRDAGDMQEALVVGVGIAAARLHFRRLPLPPSPPTPHAGKVRVINYVKITGSAGAAAGSVVLLHGFGTGFAVWAQTLPALSSAFSHVYALDLPGHGLSFTGQEDEGEEEEEEEAAAAEERWVSALESWRQTLCEEGEPLACFSLVAHSLGAYLGAAWALRCPQVFVRLVLLEPWGLSQPPDADAEMLTLPWHLLDALLPTLAPGGGKTAEAMSLRMNSSCSPSPSASARPLGGALRDYLEIACSQAPLRGRRENPQEAGELRDSGSTLASHASSNPQDDPQDEESRSTSHTSEPGDSTRTSHTATTSPTAATTHTSSHTLRPRQIAHLDCAHALTHSHTHTHCGTGVRMAQQLSRGGRFVWACHPLHNRLLGLDSSAPGLAPHIQLTVIYGKDTCFDASGGIQLSNCGRNNVFVTVIPRAGHHLYLDNSPALTEALISRLSAP